MLCTAGQNLFMLFMASVDSMRLGMTLCDMKHLVKNTMIYLLMWRLNNSMFLPSCYDDTVHNDMALLVWLLLRKLVATCR